MIPFKNFKNKSASRSGSRSWERNRESFTPGWTMMSFFFFNETATPEIYPLPLHDAFPISRRKLRAEFMRVKFEHPALALRLPRRRGSEEHTSELQSPCNLVCRLLLEQ